MEILCKDEQKKSALMTGAQHACHLLNNVVIPICKELTFIIDTSDTLSLGKYMRNINALHSDYIGKMKEGAGNPALAIVLEKSAEELWAQAYKKHPIANPYIINEIPLDVFDVLTITGSDIYTFHARTNNPAIAKACIIYAEEEDVSKRAELKEVCDALNRCFNGNGQLFPAYIAIVQGRFAPLKNIKNYKPLIYGED